MNLNRIYLRLIALESLKIYMSTYAQTYTSLLDKINTKYLVHHNLLQLKNYRTKVNCYKQNSKEADLYYECFHRTELKVSEDSQNLNKNYQFLQNEYKTCQKNCPASYSIDSEIKNCSQKCSGNFIKSTLQLYDNFYKTQLSNETEYKKIKK